MSDHLIRLLPETVANQIAAGEVVQRPASVVKELLENSIDAGADHIQLIIKDAGKLLIQVIDNGCGMNEIDARMCIERHATSKIQTADDLFRIRTMGFRGEALASIASVAHLELKTKTSGQQVGTHLIVEGSEVKSQDICQCPTGTSVAVKNLFFNVPARRNFLKSNTIEMKHIYDEFHRVAIAHPDIKFTMTENNVLRFQLEKGNFTQRIVQIFGSAMQKKLVPVDQKTDYIKVSGLLIKPEFSKKIRGEQFFFVNKRYIKSYFVHKVIANTYKPFIASDMLPGYFLFLEIDPQEIDVNVHPTKTEIKFRNESAVAVMLESSLKYAMGAFNIAPSIDFDVEPSVQFPLHDPQREIKIPKISVNPNYNPFQNPAKSRVGNKFINLSDVLPDVHDSFSHSQQLPQVENVQSSLDEADEHARGNEFLIAGNRYIVTIIRSGLLIIDIRAARERIEYDRILETLNEAKTCASQQLLYPETFELSVSQSEILIELIPELDSVGFNISHLGKQSFSCSAVPAEWTDMQQLIPFIESVIESYQYHLLDAKKEKNAALAEAMSRRISAVQMPSMKSDAEIRAFVDMLFSSSMPERSPSGNKVFVQIDYSDLSNMFLKS